MDQKTSLLHPRSHLALRKRSLLRSGASCSLARPKLSTSLTLVPSPRLATGPEMAAIAPRVIGVGLGGFRGGKLAPAAAWSGSIVGAQRQA
jgi:hypothetical protein